MARAHHLEILGPVEDQLHRPAGLERQLHSERLDMGLHLVAEAGADLGREAAQLRHRQLQALADIGLDAEHRLVGRPQGDPAGRIDFGKSADRLDGEMRLGRRFVVAFDDDVAVRPGAVDIAFGQFGLRGDIAAADGGKDLEIIRQPLVDERRVRRHRFLRRGGDRQFLVVDPDQRRRPAGGLLVFGSDDRDRLAGIAHLAFRDGVLVLDERAHPAVRKILAGEDAGHPRYRQGFANVVSLDDRMGDRAGVDCRVQHVRPDHIGDVLCTAGHLFARVEARQAGADAGCGGIERGHGLASEARTTASTIFL